VITAIPNRRAAEYQPGESPRFTGLEKISRSGKIAMAKQVRSPADIGALVRIARKEQNLRQDELAGVAGVGLRFIVDLEAGKPTAQIGKVLQVLRTLGCSVDILTPGERRQ
jgi:y4mF family transcriptional regulator